MKLPKTIKVGGSTYTIEIIPEDKAEHNGTGYYGLIKYGSRKILFQDPFPNAAQEINTILHECVHAISEDRSLKLTEEKTHNIANALTSLILDNPQLWNRINLLRSQ